MVIATLAYNGDYVKCIADLAKKFEDSYTKSHRGNTELHRAINKPL